LEFHSRLKYHSKLFIINLSRKIYYDDLICNQSNLLEWIANNPLLFILLQFSPGDTKKEQVTLTAILENQGDPERWKTLIQPAIEEMRTRHPDSDINIYYTAYPYDQAKKQMLDAISTQTQVDVISLDQIWVGEFAERGLLTDITY
jgi:ABC-type glycerol-3-phosphate transport system substrate-binding protein